MSPIYGDITLIDGRLLNALIEIGDILPAFSADDIGRLFVLSNGTFNVNNGSEWLTVQFSNTNVSNPLIATLGQNWINEDLSFNPTPFNDLDNISGLTSNDSLFSVIAALDSAISEISEQKLADLSDVSFGNLEDGDIVIWAGTDFTNSSLSDLATARLSIATTFLTDVSQLDVYSKGDFLLYSEAHNAFVNRKISFTYTNTATNSEYLIEHNLGVRYPMVQIINYATNVSITSGYSISYDGANELTLTLNIPTPVIVVVFAANDS